MPNVFSDLQHTGLVGASIVPQTVSSATTTNGSSIDFAKAEDSVDLFVLTGNCGDSTLTLDAKIQEAKEDPANPGTALSSDWSDMVGQTTSVASMPTLSGATAGDNLVVLVNSRRRQKRFVRAVVVTAGGGTLSVPVAAFVLGRLKISGAGVGYSGYGGVNT